METQEAQFHALYSRFLAWQQSQQGQSDGYEFERSFVAFCKQLNQDLFTLTLKEGKQSSPKKNPDESSRNGSVGSSLFSSGGSGRFS